MRLRICPACGYEVDAATAISDPGAVPEPGDWMLCLDCGEFGVETDEHLIRLPDGDESKEIADSPDCRRARWAWEQSRAGQQARRNR